MGFWEDTTTFAKTRQGQIPEDAESADVTIRPFDPLTQVSAGAKYIVRMLVIWFFVVPAVIGFLYAVMH